MSKADDQVDFGARFRHAFVRLYRKDFQSKRFIQLISASNCPIIKILMGTGERFYNIINAIKSKDIPILKRDPIAEVPVNVPKEVRRDFGWAIEVSDGYAKSALEQGLETYAPELNTIRYLMRENLTHREIDSSLRRQSHKNKLKKAVTVVCLRGTQKASDFKLHHANSHDDRQRFRQYREYARAASTLIIEMFEKNQGTIAPIQLLVDKMELVKTSPQN